MLKPNTQEKQYLILAYNRFYDLFEEIMSDSFWEKDAVYRLFVIKDIFSVYSETITYIPLKEFLKTRETARPIENLVGKDFFKFIRHFFSHFSLFSTWNEIWFNKDLINWNSNMQFIDKFLIRHEGSEPIKYRIREADKKKMTSISINFHKNYSKNQKSYLSEIVSEKNGVKFCAIFMKKILDTQVGK